MADIFRRIRFETQFRLSSSLADECFLMRIVLSALESGSIHTYTGGIGPRFENLGSALAAMGHEVHFVTTTINYDGSRTWPSPSVAIHVIDHARTGSPLHPLLLAKRVSGFVTTLNADVAVAAEWGGLLAPLAKERRRITAVVTNLATSSLQIRLINATHGRTVDRTFAGLLRERLERTQARTSDGTFAISHAISTWSEQLWGRLPNLEVIPNGLDICSVIEAAKRGASLIEGKKPAVVSVGRVSFWKGSDTLLAAAGDLWDRGHVFDLHLLGDLSLEMCNDINVAEGKASRSGNTLKIWGHQDRHTVLSTVRMAAVAVFPSRFEGFGNACLEARILGVPTIATQGTGFNEFCTDQIDSVLVPAGDSSVLGAAIAKLLTNTLAAQRLAAAGKERSCSFSSKKYATKVEDYFLRIAERRACHVA
ncbi:MAG: glycosyltransferase family 4 protein [Nocardiaceae bacterium]|nr:glycosyltransferase family 4 protein [Nocardiaceae bacterium]